MRTRLQLPDLWHMLLPATNNDDYFDSDYKHFDDFDEHHTVYAHHHDNDPPHMFAMRAGAVVRMRLRRIVLCEQLLLPVYGRMLRRCGHLQPELCQRFDHHDGAAKLSDNLPGIR